RFAAILTNDRRMTRGYSWSLAFAIQGLSPFDLYRLLPALSTCPFFFLMMIGILVTLSRK
ncbi:MAG: hypothetical protein U9R29_04035, partial [Thermodesulfobacteriota bacterium]|nr:hypothetical protein [Thermodesulfobacteriota bacterium]